MKGIIGKETADSLKVPLSSLADLLVYWYAFSSLISFILKSTSFPAKEQLDKPLSYPFGCHVTTSISVCNYSQTSSTWKPKRQSQVAAWLSI